MGEEIEITGWNPITGRKESESVESNQVVVKTYSGDRGEAARAFEVDAAKMAAKAYFPTSQTWVEGSWGAGSFLGALLLCLILVGIIVFIYMLIVKPDGTLSVTYELRAVSTPPREGSEKACPKCAEQVKFAAVVCRFCGHNFT